MCYLCLTSLLQAMVSAPKGFNVSHMLQPAVSVVVSMGLGVLGGTALGAVLHAKPTTMPRTIAALSRVVPQAVFARYQQDVTVADQNSSEPLASVGYQHVTNM